MSAALARPSDRPPVIVFDLDGTLVDSAPDICRFANEALASEGVAPLTLSETRRFVGGGADVFVERMRSARGLPDSAQDRLRTAFLAAYEGRVADAVLYPGVLDALAVLAARGHPLGLCTNKPNGPTRIVLDHFSITARFATLIAGDSLSVKKPDPAPLHAAIDGLGGGPALYVGDSEVDAEAAERAGVPFLLYEGGYRKAPLAALPHRASFDHFDKLPALVDRMQERTA